jgi:hypothetical protein
VTSRKRDVSVTPCPSAFPTWSARLVIVERGREKWERFREAGAARAEQLRRGRLVVAELHRFGHARDRTKDEAVPFIVLSAEQRGDLVALVNWAEVRRAD